MAIDVTKVHVKQLGSHRVRLVFDAAAFGAQNDIMKIGLNGDATSDKQLPAPFGQQMTAFPQGLTISDFIYADVRANDAGLAVHQVKVDGPPFQVQLKNDAAGASVAFEVELTFRHSLTR